MTLGLSKKRGKKRAKKAKRKEMKGMKLKYVIQKHKATTTHWDLRLQVGDKMYSWVIPKGPSLKTNERRLAIAVAPHTVGYGDFEGVIEKGLYGAGKVMQWDKGTYCFVSDSHDVKKSIQDGLLKFELHGERLKGKWALVRAGQRWFLIKMKDKYSRDDIDVVKKYKRSVKSGKTVKEISKKDGYITKEKDLGF